VVSAQFASNSDTATSRAEGAVNVNGNTVVAPLVVYGPERALTVETATSDCLALDEVQWLAVR
jgi:hypothetical protein